MTTRDAAAAMATVRRMRWWDIPAVLRLEGLLFAEDAWNDAMFWSELAERNTRHYVVAAAGADDDSVVGYAGLCSYAADQCFVQTIGVDPAYQRQGIGARLLQDLIEEAERRGCRLLDLEVRAGNDAAIAMYERFGFRAIGRRRGYYQPSGADAIVMRRESS
jgi:[ribosomal protein S18]-alanine N-acetyltransferase